MTFVGAVGNRSESDTGSYPGFVASAVADYNIFENFRRNPIYNGILEHVSYDQGQKYLDIVSKESPDLYAALNNFRINDLVGNPYLFDFDTHKQIGTTTLRYVKVLSDIRNLFGTNFDNIIEIGAGYGGQCLICDQVLKFNQYVMFDLPPVLLLISKYLESHNLNNSYSLSTINQWPKNQACDLVISNYAFSELPSQLQQRYLDKIIRSAKHGYMTMNSGRQHTTFSNDKLSADYILAQIPNSRIIEETPQTGSNNYIIIWSN